MTPLDANPFFRRLNAASVACLMTLSALSVASFAQVQPHFAEGDNVSRWKTFASRAGWSIKYPPDWRISSCRQCEDPADPGVFVAFSASSGEVLIMIEPLADKTAGQSTQQWLNEVEHATVLTPALTEDWLFIDGVPALKVINGAGSVRTENIYIAHGAKTLAIRLSDIRDSRTRSICEQILSTFRFSSP